MESRKTGAFGRPLYDDVMAQVDASSPPSKDYVRVVAIFQDLDVDTRESQFTEINREDILLTSTMLINDLEDKCGCDTDNTCIAIFLNYTKCSWRGRAEVSGTDLASTLSGRTAYISYCPK
jgi:hypothetical protein